MVQINFSKVPDNEFVLLPEAQYLVECVDIEETSSSNGNEMWVLTLKIKNGQYEGSKITDRLIDTPKALFRWKIAYKAFGIDVDWDGDVELKPDDVLARECLVDVINEEYIDKHGAKKMANRVTINGYHAINGVMPEKGVLQKIIKTDDAASNELPF